MELFDWIKRHRWDLAFVDKDWNFRFIRSPYRDRWFADPFILSVSESEVVLLVEEFSYSIGRGRIARLSVDRKNLIVTDMQIILSLDTHLSFPFIFRDAGRVLICPENSASGHSTVYAYEDASRRAVPVATVCDYPLTDAVSVCVGDAGYVLSTYIPNPNGKVLTAFEKGNDGRYNPMQEIVFEDYVARNAGAIFQRDGGLIRPAQICDGGFGYGLGIEFQRVLFCDGRFSFEAVERRFPPQGYDGLHTYNALDGVAVVDCRRYLRPALRGILHKVKGVIVK